MYRYQFPTVWVENSPDTLLDIALKYCIKHQNIFCKYSGSEGDLALQDGLSLPIGICERMLSISKTELTADCFNKFTNYFKDVTHTQLRHLDLSDSLIEDNTLAILTKHSIIELNISNCPRLTEECLPFFSMLSLNLFSLIIGESSQIFGMENDNQPTPETEDDRFRFLIRLLELQSQNSMCPPSTEFSEFHFPNLRKFSLSGIKAKAKYNYLFKIMLRSVNLTFLDLTGCELDQSDIQCLSSLKQLTTLILCDVAQCPQYFILICQIKTLRHLDISYTGETALCYPNHKKILKHIVDSLENLLSLDISGTNLAGKRTREREDSDSDDMDNTGENLTDIPGLASRVKKPLEFLGLLNTAHDACFRHHIPAKKITGDATEEQILNAGQVYCARERMIQKVLNDLFQIFRFSTCQNTKLALDVIMEAMRLHPRVKHIQVSGSASLFYIVKGESKKFFNVKMRRKIIKTLLDAMYHHFSDETLLRNACLTLIHFNIPEDVFFDYERLVSLLLIIVAPSARQDEFVHRIGLFLLNSLACQVDGFNKKLVGDHGAISIMLQLIEQRLLSNTCDEVMETAWSTMWNVTDETPINCARFLEGKGLDLFIGCLQAFPEKPELLRNMMGLLGNVAEVKDLRHHLMKDEYLSVFSDLLGSKSDGIEVSYNAAGILSHIASDGEQEWSKHNIYSVKRKDVLAKMVKAIEEWDLDTKRNINYRSFEPILRLLNVEHTPEVQHWAVWALANLTKVYPEKYCSVLRQEGGIDMLKRLLTKPSYSQILELSATIIKQCERFESGRNEDYEIEDVSETEES